MKLSHNWLIELTGLNWTPEETAEKLTLCGTACKNIEPTAKYMDKVVVGEVLTLSAIEGASKIRLAKVTTGDEELQIVCGAPNVAVGHKVPVAKIGAVLAGDMKIKKTKIKGVESSGMICSERELGISDEHEGIWVLPDEAPVGKPLAEILDYDDHILTFDLTPNRADSMSAIGIARDMAALANKKLMLPQTDIKESDKQAYDYISVTIDDAFGCPRYAARIIHNVKLAESPWWLKKKLITSGIRPINNLVDITNLVMLETGHPLHAFDLKRFGSNEVVVRQAKEKEKFITLDDKEHELDKNVTLITNGKTGVAAGGVMGGKDSEVKEDTKDLLLEAAYFNPSLIRKSRKKLGIVTESSSRFEKGANPNGIEFAINRAAHLYQQLAGGEVASGIVDCYPKKIEPANLSLRVKRCNQILGTGISQARMVEILKALEFEADNSDPIKVKVPTFRPDIEREIDLIEEIARIEGFDKIPTPQSITGPLYTPVHWEDNFKKEIRTLLTSSGFDETIAHGMVHSRMASLLEPEMKHLKLLNPVSEEVNVMRTMLATTALSVVSHNLSHRNMDIKLFELGKVYFPPDSNDDWVEEEKLILAISGSTAGNWREKPRKLDFYDLTGALDNIWAHLRLGEYSIVEQPVGWMENNMSFSISLEENEIGVIGKVSSKIARKFDIKEDVYIAEIFMGSLIARGKPLIKFSNLPVYPSAPRDLAIIVDNSVISSDIIATVKKNAGKLAESVKIFDLYTGKQIEEGKKSIAISINYRSAERNLTGEEIDIKQMKIIESLKSEFKADIRDK